MKYLLTMLLFAGLLAGCSAASSLETATQAAPPGGIDGSVNATKGSAVETTMNDATSVSKPMVITVRPPMIPIAPVQGTPAFPVPTSTPLEGWQTFTSTALGVAVDYPVDWSVNENDEGAIFTSPQGLTILLQVEKSNRNPSATGQDCSTLINDFGQTGDICFDAATFSYSAVFKKPADESTPWLTLSVISREKPVVFYQMFSSLRSVP
jgi:hypothetical protein